MQSETNSNFYHLKKIDNISNSEPEGGAFINKSDVKALSSLTNKMLKYSESYSAKENKTKATTFPQNVRNKYIQHYKTPQVLYQKSKCQTSA